MDIRIRQGKDIAIPGAPRQVIADGPPIRSVGLTGADYPGVRFAVRVEPGERVAEGQTILVDRHRPSLRITAPAAGVVTAINRGPRRSLGSLVIELDGAAAETFAAPSDPTDRYAVRDLLLGSGLWPAFIRRPFGRLPDPDETPHAIFVTAMDSNPLAVDAAVVVRKFADDFQRGLALVSALTEGTIYICHAGGLAHGDLSERVKAVAFQGPHPAGLAGTHIHRLAPTGGGRAAWQINYQDVIAIGVLAATGRPWNERVISVAGPGFRKPHLITTRLGADIDDLVAGQVSSSPQRIISGSLLAGRPSRFLGRYHQQVAVLPESEGISPFGLTGRSPTTSQHGRSGPFIPVAAFDRMLPFDIMIGPLLRALIVGDEEAAERLGCLELLEEDVALLSYVCPAKIDYAPLLRNVLDKLAGVA
ncbi:MAG: NADH:ubiquinone reductase (Na(+)-transporting) subunit A [Alphaproteobacteria bacterium]